MTKFELIMMVLISTVNGISISIGMILVRK